jgi:hypothetical protein
MGRQQRKRRRTADLKRAMRTGQHGYSQHLPPSRTGRRGWIVRWQSTSRYGCRAFLGTLANEVRVALDGPRPSPELVPSPPGRSRGRSHRPCHLRAIPSAMPPVPHGQPRTLLTVDLGALYYRYRATRTVRRGPRADRWGHIRATIDRIAADNTPVTTGLPSARLTRQVWPGTAGHPDRPGVSDTEEDALLLRRPGLANESNGPANGPCLSASQMPSRSVDRLSDGGAAYEGEWP